MGESLWASPPYVIS
jgi:hypothetical protein